jgi:hypothetical protein
MVSFPQVLFSLYRIKNKLAFAGKIKIEQSFSLQTGVDLQSN